MSITDQIKIPEPRPICQPSIPSADTLREQGVSCGTCHKRDLYDNDEKDFCMWLQVYIPQDRVFFCADHPTFNKEGG